MLLFQVINYRVCKLAGGVVLHDCYLGESYFPWPQQVSCSLLALIQPWTSFSLVEDWGHELTVTVTLCDGSGFQTVWGPFPFLWWRMFRTYFAPSWSWSVCTHICLVSAPQIAPCFCCISSKCDAVVWEHFMCLARRVSLWFQSSSWVRMLLWWIW